MGKKNWKKLSLIGLFIEISGEMENESSRNRMGNVHKTRRFKSAIESLKRCLHFLILEVIEL